jgi:hypothetical protein
MIVFDLECRAGAHRFEGWFGSSDDYERQREGGLLACPVCGSGDVGKAIMAPSIPRKGNQLPEPVRGGRGGPGALPAPGVVSNAGPGLPPEALAMLRAVALAQAEAIKSSRWVGQDFAEEARAMHYGERDRRADPRPGQPGRGARAAGGGDPGCAAADPGGAAGSGQLTSAALCVAAGGVALAAPSPYGSGGRP